MSKAVLGEPILIIGWKIARTMNGYKSVIDKELGVNIWWTFAKMENRSQYETDLEEFINKAYDIKLSSINYNYVNIIKLRYSKAKKLISIVSSLEDTNVYESHDMVYIPFKGGILGISLAVGEYCGIKKRKIMKLIDKKRVHLINDDDKGVFYVCKRLGSKRYALPYFV